MPTKTKPFMVDESVPPTERHALITGPIAGRIPTPDSAIPHDYIDVTPDVLYFADPAHLDLVADAIEDEHWVRQTHPVQVSLREHEELAAAGLPHSLDLAKDHHRQVEKRVHARGLKRLKDQGTITMALASALAENNAIAGVFAAAQPTPSTTNTWCSLHTATTGTTGAAEYAGVTRIQYSVGAPAAGSITNTATATFTTSGASAVTYLGTWDALTTGNFRIGAALSSSVQAVTIAFAVGSQTFSAS